MVERNLLHFRVYGIPRPKGSTRSFAHPKTGKVVTLHDNTQTKPWQSIVAAGARGACGYAGVWDGPVGVHFTAYLPRPRSVSVRKRPLPIVKPDLDKLERALLDALTGIIYHDDAQVCSSTSSKQYATSCEAVGVVVIVSRLSNGPEP